MTEQAIAKIGRDNHLNNLVARLPILTTLYGMQCLFVHYMVPEINTGDFALFLGLFLITFVSSMYVYDRYHHIVFFKDHILIYFEPLNIARKIHYEDILEVHAPSEECDFSSILIELKDKDTVSLHFVDYPVQVKKVLLELIKKKSSFYDSENTDNQAA